MPEKPKETKEELTIQLDKLKANLADFEADETLDKAARVKIANAMRESIKMCEEALAKMK